VALIDSGATENFLNLSYTKWLRPPIKMLKTPWKLYNVDGTENKVGELQYYVDLETRMGTTTTKLRFFLSDLGEHKATPGYPNIWRKEEYQKSIDGMKRYSARKNPNDYPNTLYGTMQ
jgi:hypothetical protein